MIGTTAAVNVSTGNVLTVATALTWAKAGIPAKGHQCFVAVLDQAEDPAPPIPGPTNWNGFRDIIRNHNNITWRNFNIIDVLPDPAADPVAMPFLLTGDPGGQRRFDIEIAVHLPEDAKLQLELHPAAAAALPAMWRERLTFRKDRAILEVLRLRSNALCGALLPPEALQCRFILKPSKRLAAGNHTIAIRKFEAGVQLGGGTWMLRPAKKKGKG